MPKRMGIQRYNANERLKEAEAYEASTSLAEAQESGKDYSAAEHTRRSMVGEKEFSDGSVRVWNDYEQRWETKKK